MSSPTLVSLVHLGCARNLIDSEVLLARLAEAGALVTPEPAEAQVVVVNTCSFIGAAREESRAAIEGAVRQKLEGGLKGVVVAGCLVQRYKRDLLHAYPGVDLFAEISDYRSLGEEVVRLARGEGVPRYLASDRPGDGREGSRLLATPGSYAYLRISHGCDHLCGFCAIPAIRGKHRSKRPGAVLEEARELIASGVRELVLVAEDSTAWGRDLGSSLPALVEGLAELEGEHRIRIMYAYPHHFPWDLVPLLRDHPRVLPYLDMPVQHIATPVLRAMRRAGSGDQVRAIVDRLLEEVPGLTLRTTVLLGYPGETEEDVEELLEFMGRTSLGRLGAFPFSPEEGTVAPELEGRVAPEVIEERCRRVGTLRDEILARSQGELVGQELEVLVDEVHPDAIVGRTAMDAPEVDPVALLDPAAFEGADPGALIGQRLRVRVDALEGTFDLRCSPLEPAESVGEAS